MKLREFGRRFKKRLASRILKALSSVDSRGWIPLISESFLGAFSQDVTVTAETSLTHPTVYACVTQVASDIGKMRLRLTEKTPDGIWQETEAPAFTPVLRKPCVYLTRQKFIEYWLISKLTHGNTYALKQRDNRGVVTNLWILDPYKVTTLVSTGGAVFYRLSADNLSTITEGSVVVPAREIIHDTMETLFHPLIGVSPMYAAAVATTQGLNILNGSSKFFGNNSQPGGVLTAPGPITDDVANRLKTKWETNYTGENAGKVAVLGDGLKYEAMAFTATDSQLVEQARFSDEKICSVYKVPPYKVYVGALPTYQNAEILDKIYFSSCLQRLIEAIEALLDDGLALPAKYKTEFNVEDLLRMDSSLKMKTAGEGVKSAILTINEARSKFNLPKVKGGDTPYMQQQNYSLEALAERDKTNPLAAPQVEAPQDPPELTEEELEEETAAEQGKLFLALKKQAYEDLTK